MENINAGSRIELRERLQNRTKLLLMDIGDVRTAYFHATRFGKPDGGCQGIHLKPANSFIIPFLITPFADF